MVVGGPGKGVSAAEAAAIAEREKREKEAAIKGALLQKSMEEWTRKLFDAYDMNGNNFLETEELRCIKTRLSSQASTRDTQFWAKARIGPEDLDAATSSGLSYENFRELIFRLIILIVIFLLLVLLDAGWMLLFYFYVDRELPIREFELWLSLTVLYCVRVGTGIYCVLSLTVGGTILASKHTRQAHAADDGPRVLIGRGIYWLPAAARGCGDQGKTVSSDLVYDFRLFVLVSVR